MIIELFDMDVPYEVASDINCEGKEYVKICPNSAQDNRDEDYDINLDYYGVQQLIRTLQFIAEEIKPKDNDR